MLGYDPGEDAILDALESLGLNPQQGSAGIVETTIPTWRPDLVREVDLVEEVARHRGYDEVPSILPEGLAAPHAPDVGRRLEERDEGETDDE